MHPAPYEGVSLDLCPACEGYWLDKGELKEICDRRDQQFTEEERDRFFDEMHDQQGRPKDFRALEPEYSCLRCEVPMQRVEYAYSSTIVIDRCMQCDGIYLDAGELEKLQIWAEERDAYQPHRDAAPESHSMVAGMAGGLLSSILESILRPRRY